MSSLYHIKLIAKRALNKIRIDGKPDNLARKISGVICKTVEFNFTTFSRYFSKWNWILWTEKNARWWKTKKSNASNEMQRHQASACRTQYETIWKYCWPQTRRDTDRSPSIWNYKLNFMALPYPKPQCFFFCNLRINKPPYQLQTPLYYSCSISAQPQPLMFARETDLFLCL